MAVTPDEEQTLRDLLELIDRFLPGWANAIDTDDAWQVDEGSSMATDDASTAPYQVSHSAWHAMTVAVDHLRGLRAALVGETNDGIVHLRVFTNSHATLVRAALENAARAVWMLGPDDRRARIAHRLALEGGEITPSLRMHALVGKVPKRNREQRQQQLRQIAAIAGIPAKDHKLITAGTRYSDIVRGAADLIDFEPDLAEFIWRACSSLAHGDISGTLSLADKEIVSNTGGINTVRITGSIGVLSWCTGTAILMIRAAFHYYEQRANTPPVT